MKERKKGSPRRCKAEKIIIEIGELAQKFDFIKNAKETAAFLKFMKSHLDEMKATLLANSSFAELAADRSAMKYYGVDKEDFQAKLQRIIDEETAKFKRAEKMSDESYSRLRSMSEKAKKSREENKMNKNEDELDDILKDI